MSAHLLRQSFALGLAMLVLQGCGDATPSVAGDSTPVVSTAPTQVVSLPAYLTVTGTLVPVRAAMVYAQTPGLVVTELLAEEGQMVKSGQLLARLSSDRQRAELAGARGELNRAQRALARAEVLKKDGALAHSDAESAAASHAQSLARVGALEIEVARAEVRAPASGLLMRRHVEVGDVANGNALFQIAADSAIELRADLSESVWRQARVGQRADVTLADGRALAGKVRRLSGALDERSRLGRVWISLNEAPDSIVSGSGATAHLHIAASDVLAVPQSTLLFDDRGAYVFVAADGKASRRSVVLGVENGVHAQILSGLDAGDRVVGKAGSLLRDGDPIRLAAEIVNAKGAAQ